MTYILAILFVFFFLNPAYPCSCAIGEEVSKRNISDASYIFKGKVIYSSKVQFDGDPRDFDWTVTPPRRNPLFWKIILKVEQLYKGIKGTQTVTAFLHGIPICSLSIEEIIDHIFFVLYDLDGDNVIAGMCGSYIGPKYMKALQRGEYLAK